MAAAPSTAWPLLASVFHMLLQTAEWPKCSRSLDKQMVIVLHTQPTTNIALQSQKWQLIGTS